MPLSVKVSILTNALDFAMTSLIVVPDSPMILPIGSSHTVNNGYVNFGFDHK